MQKFVSGGRALYFTVRLRPLVKDGDWTDAMEQRGGERSSLYRVADHYISPVWLRPLVKDGGWTDAMEQRGGQAVVCIGWQTTIFHLCS